MTKIYYVLVFMYLFVSSGFAHDANKAFFKIQQKDNVVEVQAEFPWSVRNAILEAYPELANSKSQEDFNNAFFKYVSTNLEIRNGDFILELISIKEAAHEGHSHQNNFIFQYKGNAFDFITNTMMFNVYDNQKNYHDILMESEHLENITSIDSPSFEVRSTSKMSFKNITQIGLLVLGFSVLALLLWYRVKIKHN